jgi:hypothetical protein
VANVILDSLPKLRQDEFEFSLALSCNGLSAQATNSLF